MRVEYLCMYMPVEQCAHDSQIDQQSLGVITHIYTKKLESQMTDLGHGIGDSDNCLTVFDAVDLIVSITVRICVIDG